MAGLKRRGGLLVVVALLALVNLPLVHGAWVGRQVARDGVEVTATVVASHPAGDAGVVDFRYDETVDPDQDLWQAALEPDAFDRAVDSEAVQVRVVPGEPGRYDVVGEAGAGLLVALTIFADVVLVLALVLLARRREQRALVLVATEDVTRARPGGRLERLSPTTYVVVGEVVTIEAEAIELDTGAEGTVRVLLGEHVNPVGYQQPAQVRCRVPDSAT